MSLLTASTTLTIASATQEGATGHAWDSATVSAAATRLASADNTGVELTPGGATPLYSKILALRAASGLTAGLDSNHVVSGITVSGRCSVNLLPSEFGEITMQLRINDLAGGTVLSENKATSTGWASGTNRSWGGTSDLWTSGAPAFAAALRTGSFESLDVLFQVGGVTLPATFVLDQLSLVVTSVRSAMIDLGVLERLVVARLAAAIPATLATLRYPGEEPPVQTEAAALPWVQLIGVSRIESPTGPRGHSPSPDKAEVSFALVIGVPDGAMRSRGYAMATAMSLLRIALLDLELRDDSTGHVLRLADMTIARDPTPDELLRVTTAQVTVNGWALRTTGGELEGL